jgi:hypothetical protein
MSLFVMMDSVEQIHIVTWVIFVSLNQLQIKAQSLSVLGLDQTLNIPGFNFCVSVKITVHSLEGLTLRQ